MKAARRARKIPNSAQASTSVAAFCVGPPATGNPTATAHQPEICATPTSKDTAAQAAVFSPAVRVGLVLVASLISQQRFEELT